MPVPSFLELNLIRKKLILDLKYKTCETQCFIRIFSWEKSTFVEFINTVFINKLFHFLIHSGSEKNKIKKDLSSSKTQKFTGFHSVRSKIGKHIDLSILFLTL